MADINNFSQTGLGSLVQFGKRGLKILTDTTSDYFKFTDNDGSTLVEVRGANATVASAFLTKGQFDSATQAVAQYVSTEVAYNTGSTTLFEIPAGAMVYGVTVDVNSPWVSATDATAIIVGDSGDTDRLFTTQDADMTETFQFQSNYMARYSSATDIVATVTAGSASSGVATITVLVVTANLTVKDLGSIADNGSV
tara:strand:- start:4251 stop:4838 length:588 start_codon:yes stop_codon:yes gene_type:complete